MGDVGPTIEALLPRLKARTDRHFLDEALEACARHARAELDKHAVVGKRERHPSAISRRADFQTRCARTPSTPPTAVRRWSGAFATSTSTGANRTIVSLSHGTMANAMPQALGAAGGVSGSAGDRDVRETADWRCCWAIC